MGAALVFRRRRCLVGGVAAALLMAATVSACTSFTPGPPPPANSPVKVEKRVTGITNVGGGVSAVQFEAVISLPTARSQVVLTDTVTNAKGEAALILPDPYQTSSPSSGRIIATKSLGDLAAGTYTVEYFFLISPSSSSCVNTMNNDVTITDRNGFVAKSTISFTTRCGPSTPTGDVGPADEVFSLSDSVRFTESIAP